LIVWDARQRRDANREARAALDGSIRPSEALHPAKQNLLVARRNVRRSATLVDIGVNSRTTKMPWAMQRRTGVQT
jgi:hypothetical protein